MRRDWMDNLLSSFSFLLSLLIELLRYACALGGENTMGFHISVGRGGVQGV